MPTPTNPKLYEAVKKKIMKSYKKNSGFASGAIVKEYKRQGGKYKEDGEPKKLKRWFKEEWINVNPLLGITNEDAYPTFRPTIKVNKETPTIVSNISKEELKKQYALKQKYKGEQNLPTFKPLKKGKGLKADTFRALLESSYEGGDVAGFTMDKQLSTTTSKVYTHPSGQVVVAHRGTAGTIDWGNNAVYAMGGDLAYKLTSRYREAKKVQQNAEKKYGAKNITTIGHSQGGLQAQLLGGNTKEIITLNKATRPQELLFGSSKKKNQYDVRASGDAVSAFRNPFQLSKEETIKSKANPLAQHSTDILESKEDEIVGDRTFYGNGIRKKGKKGIGLKADKLKKLLNNSYEKGGEVEGYKVIHQTDTAKLYEPINEAGEYNGDKYVVAHRGTEESFKDWMNNAKLFNLSLGEYKKTLRFQKAQQFQKTAEGLVGARNIITIGHSQGGLLAELVGKNTSEIITYNKAAVGWLSKVNPPNQTDIRANIDLVSAGTTNPAIVIDADNLSPHKAHGMEVLDTLEDLMVGKKGQMTKTVFPEDDTPERRGIKEAEIVYLPNTTRYMEEDTGISTALNRGELRFRPPKKKGNGIIRLLKQGKGIRCKEIQNLLTLIVNKHLGKSGGMIVKSFNDHPDNKGVM